MPYRMVSAMPPRLCALAAAHALLPQTKASSAERSAAVYAPLTLPVRADRGCAEYESAQHERANTNARQQRRCYTDNIGRQPATQ